MHQVMKSFPHAGKLKKYIEDPDFTRQNWETFQLLVATPIGNSLTQDELSTIKEIDQRMAEYMRKSYPPEMEEYSVIHGDLALEHAQFLPDGNAYFFDFTNMSWAPIVREIAVFLVQLYTREQDSTTLKRWEKLRTLSLEGYQSVSKLSEVDLTAIKSMMMRALIEELMEFDRLTYERDEVACILRRKRGYELAGYLLHQN
jgi:Ser/Thr protein kinase RdoA (MazF antagonist)